MMKDATHWRARTKDGSAHTSTDPAKALAWVLDNTSACKIHIAEGAKDGAFFRTAYSPGAWPRSFDLTRKEAAAFVANPATLPELTAFADEEDAA